MDKTNSFDSKRINLLPPLSIVNTAFTNLKHFHGQTPRNRFALHTYIHTLFPRVYIELIFPPFHNIIKYF